MAGFIFNHPRLGAVRVLSHPTSQKVSARWKQDHLKVVVPAWMSRKNVVDAIARMEDDIQRMKTRQRGFKIKDIVNDDWTITLGRQSRFPRGVTLGYSLPDCSILFGEDIDMESDNAVILFNRAALAIGKKVAPALLLPRAREIAAHHGCQPSSFQISHGMKVLGHCNNRKSISLSYINVFLPPHLRDYIICHELAHLTEMNHSERFHAVCDSYVDGREKELIKELHHFQWPIKR